MIPCVGPNTILYMASYMVPYIVNEFLSKKRILVTDKKVEKSVNLICSVNLRLDSQLVLRLVVFYNFAAAECKMYD